MIWLSREGIRRDEAKDADLGAGSDDEGIGCVELVVVEACAFAEDNQGWNGPSIDPADAPVEDLFRLIEVDEGRLFSIHPVIDQGDGTPSAADLAGNLLGIRFERGATKIRVLPEISE